MPTLSIRIDIGPNARIGPGKVRLLELIGEHGSISAAGRALNMSYRRAWTLVDEMNTFFESPVIVAQPGGRSGGGAELTAFGSRLVSRYRKIESDSQRAAAQQLRALQASLKR